MENEKQSTEDKTLMRAVYSEVRNFTYLVAGLVLVGAVIAIDKQAALGMATTLMGAIIMKINPTKPKE